MNVERLKHWATANGVAACEQPARLEDITQDLSLVTCKHCRGIAHGRPRFHG